MGYQSLPLHSNGMPTCLCENKLLLWQAVGMHVLVCAIACNCLGMTAWMPNELHYLNVITQPGLVMFPL